MSLVLGVTRHRSNNIDLTSIIMFHSQRCGTERNMCHCSHGVAHVQDVSARCSNDFIVPYVLIAHI